MTRNLVSEAVRHAASGLTLKQAAERMGISIQSMQHIAASNGIDFLASTRRSSDWSKPTTQKGLRDYYTGIKSGLSRWPGARRAEQ